MKKTIFVMLVFLLAFTCQDDDLTNEPNSENPTEQNDTLFQQNNFGTSTSRNFIGRVINAEGQRINDAQVTIGNAIASTDHNGVFVINNASVYEKFAYVKATKSGYLTGSKAIVPTLNGSNDIVITLLEKNVIATISSGEETVVDYEGSQIIFPGDFVDTSGNLYSGQVEVSMHYLAPNRSETFAQMPGMLFGQTEANTAVSMETYGMLGVELLGTSGESLNLAEGSPATVEFPIAEEQLGIAPNTMNLWHFDEDQGYWKEEGSATRVGEVYIAEVAHFSWWNCDLPLDYVSVCFSLESIDGIDLSNHYVEIIRYETNQTIFGGYTNNEGQECGLFPANETVIINVYGTEECQEDIIHTEQVGPFSSDGVFTINIPLQNVQITTIMATVNNCNGEPLTNGYAFVFESGEGFDFSNSNAIQITNGNIIYDQIFCQANNNYNIIIYDNDLGQTSGIIEDLILTSPITNLGVLSTCEQSGGVFNGNVQLLSQAEVDSFGLFGYLEINGELLIGGEGVESNITDLSALSTLNYVSILEIHGNNLLFDLNGVEGLTSVDELKIYHNNSLTTLQSLHNLSGDLNFMSFKGNESLLNLQGLQGISTVEYLYFNYCNLITLEGLEGLTNIVSFDIFGSDTLESLSGLSNSIISSRVTLQVIPNLNSLEGLNIENSMDIVVVNNLPISSLQEISNLTQLNKLTINSCDNLVSLVDLELLESVFERLHIYKNSSLTSLDGLDNLVSSQEIRIGEHYNSDLNYGNISLIDFCALQNLFTNGTYNIDDVYIEDNAYNPSVQDIIDGDCAQ